MTSNDYCSDSIKHLNDLTGNDFLIPGCNYQKHWRSNTRSHTIGTIWFNKIYKKVDKVKIYKSVMRPILAYGVEANPRNNRNENLKEN